MTLQSVSEPAGFSGECHPIFKEDISQKYLGVFRAYKNIESFHHFKNNELSITVISRANKDRTRKTLPLCYKC